MADPELVQTFVSGIRPAIAEIRAQGVNMHRAANAGEREFIPCFDHKHRDWNRIEAGNARAVFAQQIEARGIQTRPFCELLEICLDQGQVSGVVVLESGRIQLIACEALVLATGGFGGLFKHRLTSDDVCGSVQSLALKCGARLINMEFMQIMPGYLSPAYKTVFNEKTFRFARLTDCTGKPLLAGMTDARELLDERAGHGPFTTRLRSRRVDLAIFEALRMDPAGVTVTYSPEMIEHPPELIRTYFDWLAEAKNLDITDPAWIGLFAHAANGGILIAPDTSTGVPGLFACGEATGGMHGADRIGGLSTANGLVFGGIAGRTAARYAAENPVREGFTFTFKAHAASDIPERLGDLRELMYSQALVIRTEQGLTAGLAQIEQMASQLQPLETADAQAIAATHRFEAQLTTARAILMAARLRRESRGSHFRGDYPDQNPGCSQPILICRDTCSGSEGIQLTARFRNDEENQPLARALSNEENQPHARDLSNEGNQPHACFPNEVRS